MVGHDVFHVSERLLGDGNRPPASYRGAGCDDGRVPVDETYRALDRLGLPVPHNSSLDFKKG